MRSYQALVNNRTGIVTALNQYSNPILPKTFIGYNTTISDTRSFNDSNQWRANPASFGASLFQSSIAKGAAMGEAVERYCGNFIPDGLIKASSIELESRGIQHVHPQALNLFNDRQYGDKNFPFVRFERTTIAEWIEGINIKNLQTTLVPAPLVFLDYYTNDRRNQPPITPLQYAGIAAGRDSNEAINSAFYELVERDSMTLWWYGLGSVRRIVDWEQNTELACDLWEDSKQRNIQMYYVENEFKAPIIFTLILDRRNEILAFGSACRPNLHDALFKATIEAYSVLCIVKDLISPNSPLHQALKEGLFPESTYKPFRKNRNYTKDYYPPFANMTDLPAVGQYYLDPKAQSLLMKVLSRADVTSWEDIESNLHKDKHFGVLDRFDPIATDLTTSDVALAGLSVWRLIIPGFYNNPCPAYPYLAQDNQRCYARRMTNQPLPLPIA